MILNKTFLLRAVVLLLLLISYGAKGEGDPECFEECKLNTNDLDFCEFVCVEEPIRLLADHPP